MNGDMIWKLSHFPEGYPLGHVQLYAAAAAAAVGQATCIWVGRAKMQPHRPVAGLQMPSAFELNCHGQAAAVMDYRVTAMYWKGPVNPEAAPAAAEGILCFLGQIIGSTSTIHQDLG